MNVGKLTEALRGWDDDVEVLVGIPEDGSFTWHEVYLVLEPTGSESRILKGFSILGAVEEVQHYPDITLEKRRK